MSIVCISIKCTCTCAYASAFGKQLTFITLASAWKIGEGKGRLIEGEGGGGTCRHAPLEGAERPMATCIVN